MAIGAVIVGPADRAGAAEAKKLRVLVLTGGHSYDKKTFPETFQGQADIDFKIQEGGKPFEDISKWDYDVMVLFNFRNKISETSRANFLKLLERGVGLVVMHHAVSAYPNWVEYNNVIGATYSLKKGLVRNGMKFMRPVWKHDVDFNVRIEDKSHPITKGMSDFKIHDESYKGWAYHPGSHLLLSTDQKLNNHRLAWTRFYKKARVFFIQLGHGKQAFQSKEFQKLTAQGIRWTAGRLPAGPGADPRKVVFLWSGGHHPNEESSKLLARCLKTAVNAPDVKTEVYENWPADPKTLNDAAAVVIYSEGADKKGPKKHPILTPERMKILADLKAKGLGVVIVHFGLYGWRAVEAPKMLDWVGAYYDFEGYGSVHRVSRKPLVCSPVSPDHPISRGWKKFTLKENEMYHNLKFAKGVSVVPILTAPLMSKGKGKGNVTAWAIESKSGGRGFGFGGGHFVSMWRNEDCRRMMLNGVLWAAKIQVPFDGIQTSLPAGGGK
jgi:hypothetical protein